MTFMSSEISELDDQQKELCAILVMRTMLEDYSKDTGISYEKVFLPIRKVTGIRRLV